MNEKDFVAYEYATKTVKAKDKTKFADMCEAFGWEITSCESSVLGGVTLSMRRDRKLKHKQELSKIERQAEEAYENINKLKSAKTLGAKIFAYIFGVISTLMLGGGMCLTMVIENNIPAFVGGIILGIAGIALCSVNYFIYAKLAERKTKQLLPVIDESEETFANLLEKGNGLLSVDLI